MSRQVIMRLQAAGHCWGPWLVTRPNLNPGVEAAVEEVAKASVGQHGKVFSMAWGCAMTRLNIEAIPRVWEKALQVFAQSSRFVLHGVSARCRGVHLCTK